MAFTPRLSEPSSSSPYWKTTGSGGYNKCINISNGSVLPNCVGYAYGRFMEIMGATSCNLSTHNAGTWFGNTSDGYSRGNTPKLGAVVCWNRPGDAGHVAIVEEIQSDGKIVTSNSAYGGKRFYTQTLSPPDYTWSSNYKLQGFIYNPSTENGGGGGVNRLTQFLQVAQSQIGKKQDWVRSVINCGDIEWCAAFVCACAKLVEVLDVVIPHSYGCGTLAQTGVNKGMGQFLKGPWWGVSITPQPGDLILFRGSGGSSDLYSSRHIGIVTSCDGQTVYTIEGNTVTWDRHTSSIKDKSYSVTSNSIGGYFRPNWASVGGAVDGLLFGCGGIAFSLYNTSNTREDAAIREIGYLDSDYKPSISTSKIKLSVINYTSKLADIFSQFSVAYGGNGSVSVDGIDNPSARAVLEFLIGKGLNAAAACGVCGNIEHESVPAYNTASVGDYGTSFGICQWHNERGTAMKRMAGDDWASDLTGQLEYLWYELTTTYSSRVLVPLQQVPNTEDGARKAADIFVRKFEVPADIEGQTILRQASAVALFQKCIVQQTSVTGGIATQVKTQSGKTPSNSVTHTIPSSVRQSGITQNYTNYSYFYGRWASSSIQKKLAEIWNQQGKPSNRNIATISGYYCIAITLTLGTTGDIVTVVLEDGTSFNCIVADSKGANPALNGESGNQYGHAFGNGTIDIIEWEKKGSAASNVDNHTQIDLTGWSGKKVSKIINHGSYFA